MLNLEADIPHADLSLSKLRRDLLCIFRDLQIEDKDTSIVIVDDKAIKKLNREYRSINKSTDVLSFAISEGEFSEFSGGMLGDIIVSLETARVQAKEKSKSIQQEVTFLTIHGLLHLLGYDHQSDRQERTMNRESTRLIKLLSDPVVPAAKIARKKPSVAARPRRNVQ
jgi:probable rRNA maturation factor